MSLKSKEYVFHRICFMMAVKESVLFTQLRLVLS